MHVCSCAHACVRACTCLCWFVLVRVCVHVWMHTCAGVHQLACIKRHAQQPSAKAYRWISELNQLIVVQQAVLILQWRQPGILQHFFQFPAMCLLHGGAQFNTPVQENNFLFFLAWPDIQFGFPVRCETTTASLGQDQVWNPSCVKQLMKTSGWESLLSHMVKFSGLFTYIYIYKTDLKVGEKKPMETVQDTTQNLSPVLRCSAVNSAYWRKMNVQGLFYVCTVCIWHCEHTRFCVEVFFMCYINFHSFIHSIWFNSISNVAHLNQAEYGHEGRGGMGMGGGQIQSAEPCQPCRQMEGGSTNT